MATSDRQQSVRKSLPLSERDLHDLAVLRGSHAHRVALSQLADVDVTEQSSEAAMLHAVLEAGIKAVERLVEDAGYAQIAAAATEDRQATARRRRPSWADE